MRFEGCRDGGEIRKTGQDRPSSGRTLLEQPRLAKINSRDVETETPSFFPIFPKSRFESLRKSESDCRIEIPR